MALVTRFHMHDPVFHFKTIFYAIFNMKISRDIPRLNWTKIKLLLSLFSITVSVSMSVSRIVLNKLVI